MRIPFQPQERHIEGVGTTNQQWQAWPGLALIPTITAHALAPPGRRVVIVAPHPDDEVLACGGLLQLLVAQGNYMVLVAVTDGDASHPGSTLWPPERLRRMRPLESAQSLAAMGVAFNNCVRMRLPDGGVTGQLTRLRARLAALLHPGDIVLTTWRLDGHPDHEACGLACALATADSGASLVEMPVWTWHWAIPGDIQVPWQRAHRLLLPDAVLRRKRTALHCFASQMQVDTSTGQPPIVAPHALERLLHPYEVYFL